MAQQLINNGTTAGDGTGENLHTAFEKVNENDTELYNLVDAAQDDADAAAAAAASEAAQNDEQEIAVGIGRAVTSITYNASGQVTQYVEGGITYTLTYNANGTVNTVSNGTITRTVGYNGDGSVATYI